VSRPRWVDAIGLIVLTLVVYVASGTLGAYLARDDFQWLNDARDLGLRHAFVLSGRSHFYRPVVEAWWVGATHVCGASTACYHSLELGLHVINGVLLLWLTGRIFGRRDLAVASAALFVVVPSYVQAVLWVCAVTTAFAAMWYLLALHGALAAARHPERPWRWAALACAAAAMYSHEATITLLATIPLVAWAAGAARRPNRIELASAVALVAALVTTTVIANRRNYVFAERHYMPGAHIFGHAWDYLRSIYVGSGSTLELTIVAVCALLIVFRGTRPMRAGLLWLLVTMPPYLSFTWGNVGRYTYLPSIGFAWIAAGAIIALRDTIDRHAGRSSRLGLAIATALVLAVSGRYVAFTVRAIRGEVRWMAAYRAYGESVQQLIPQDMDTVTLPPPSDPSVEREYVGPMMEWRLTRPRLQVRFEGPAR